jgi:hypothetical protein
MELAIKTLCDYTIFLFHKKLKNDHKKYFSRLVEGEAGVAVRLEDLSDRVYVGRRAEVETEVVRDGRVHDGPGDNFMDQFLT